MPCTRPEKSASSPHCEPRIADTAAATSSVKRAAPGSRTIRPPSTAGRRHIPYRLFCAAGIATNARVTAARRRKRGGASAANEADRERTATRVEREAVVAGIGEEEKVRRLVLEALAAGCAEQHDLGRARGDGLGDRELEVRLVLRRREL